MYFPLQLTAVVDSSDCSRYPFLSPVQDGIHGFLLPIFISLQLHEAG